MLNNQSSSRSEMARISRFSLVGIVNTLIDFVLYNILSSKAGLSLIQSNIISTTVAMIFSFAANKKVVFTKTNSHFAKQAVLFFLVTAFGLYVIQTATIKILTEVWLTPITLGLAAAHAAGITRHDQFLTKNGAKAVGTALSLTWNYIMYKKVVFS